MSDVVHQPEQQQFVCIVNGHEAHLRYRLLDDQRVDAFTTFVPPEGRGSGVAGKLAQALYDWSQAEGLTIVPSCSYIATWLSRHANA